MDTETLDLLRSSVRSLLSDPPADIAGALEELGWSEVVAEDRAASYTTLFGLQGELGVGTALLDGVAVAALGRAPHIRVIWPWQAGPGVLGLVLADLPDTAQIVLPVESGVVSVERSTVGLRPVAGIDPDAGWALVEGEVPEGPPEGDWSAALAAARQALAAELTGIGRRALEVAVEHVRSRVQFGRPIGSFQAVRHQLAGAHANLAGAEALVAASWSAGPEVAAVAKAVAGAACREASAAAMQVCGGMGLSDEHPLPRVVRRGMLLECLLGTGRELESAAGYSLLECRIPVPAGEF